MEVVIEDQGQLKKKLTITVPNTEVKAAYDKVYHSLKGKVKVKGFRPGKMPQAMMEKRFKRHMAEEAMETLVPEYYQKAMEQEKLVPAIRPVYNDLEIDKSSPLVFSATVEVWPEVKLPKADKFKLKKTEIKASKDEIETQLTRHLERYATFAEKTDAAADGDRVTISFTGATEDGHDVSQPDHHYVIGSKQFIPEFEEALAGMKAGDKKEFDAMLPADHPKEEFRSKNAKFHVDMTLVESRKLPEIDDEFLKNYEGSAATKTEFNKLVKDEVIQIKEQRESADLRADLRDQITSSLKFEVPGTLLTQEIEFQTTQIQRNDEKIEGKELTKKAEEDAVKALRFIRFIQVYQENANIEVGQEEVYNRFSMNAQMLGMNPIELAQNEQGRAFYEDTWQMVLEEKVLDHLAAQVAEKPATKPAAKPAKKAASKVKEESAK
ncbi:MAG: trigger factor [SAR324 cluster bacterium]|nr:trigger factor [SAR324 cluster bacterium]